MGRLEAPISHYHPQRSLYHLLAYSTKVQTQGIF